MPEDHCIFRFAGLLAAVPARDVLEVVPLPALSPIPETPSFVVGAFNLRGRAVPVLDLALRLTGAAHERRVSDHVVVVEHRQAAVGLLVQDTLDVAPLDATDVEPPLAHAHAQGPVRFVAGVAKQMDRLVTILDAQALVSLPEEPGDASAARAAGDGRWSQEALGVLEERARGLAEPTKADPEDRRDVAVVELGGECLAVDSACVREFAPLSGLTVVPGVPRHVMGLMTIRGEIITVVDLRPVLSLRMSGERATLVGVVEAESGAVGLAVERAHDVVPLRFAPSSPDGGNSFFSGGGTYSDRHVSLLDLERLLASGVLLVNEEAPS